MTHHPAAESLRPLVNRIDRQLVALHEEERMLRAARDVLQRKLTTIPTFMLPSKKDRRPSMAEWAALRSRAIRVASSVDEFTRSEFEEIMGCSSLTAMNLIKSMCNNKPYPILRKVGNKRSTRYEYIRISQQLGGRAPRSAHEVERRAGVGAARRATGAPVAHTRAKGPSGKPGRDKRMAAKGYKVKRARQGT